MFLLMFPGDAPEGMTGGLQLCIAARSARRQPFGTRRGEWRGSATPSGVSPHGEEARERLSGRCCASPGEPWGPVCGLILRDARNCALLRMRRDISSHAQEIALADLDAVVAQNSMRGRGVKIKIR